MIRKEQLKNKLYPKEYKELYNYLYNLDVDWLFDNSEYNYNKKQKEIDYFTPNFFINDEKSSYNIRIVDYSNHLFIKLEDKIPYIPASRYKHEKLELYMFENLEDLLSTLKSLINPFLIGEINA